MNPASNFGTICFILFPYLYGKESWNEPHVGKLE
jgi:hypothetical protein